MASLEVDDVKVGTNDSKKVKNDDTKNCDRNKKNIYKSMTKEYQ